MLQSYNRYAYVMNNPLNLTDLSGYFSLKKFLRAAVAIAVAIYAPQYIANFLQAAAPMGGALVSGGTMITAGGLQAAGLSTLGSMVSGALAGFASGAIASGSLQGGLQGALSGGVFGGIGAAGSAGGWSSSAFVAAHAAGGCITSVAGGGSCGSGAASAAFGKFTTLAIGDMQGDFAKGVASVVAGGVGSVIAGGKFENGAVTAAYGYLFNHVASHFNRQSGFLAVVDVDSGKTVVGSFFSGTGSGDQIPPGDYAILQRGDKDGFRLEPYDALFGNDKHDVTGQSLLRLHGPGRSNGCVTACDASGWDQVKSLILSTSATQVEVTRYKSITAPGGHLLGRIAVGTEKVNYYGRLKVE